MLKVVVLDQQTDSKAQVTNQITVAEQDIPDKHPLWGHGAFSPE